MTNTPLATATSGVRMAFDRDHEAAKDALERLVSVASRELEYLKNPEYLPSTDFVSQYAQKYAAAVERMQATSNALAALAWLTRETNKKIANG